MSKSSKTSIRSLGRRVTRKKHRDRQKSLKPFGFCCDMDHLDPETRYDRQRLPSASSFTAVSPIQGSPTLKFRLQSTAPNIGAIRKKSSRGKLKPKIWNQEENLCVPSRGPLLWYQEDEISVARNIVWSEKQRAHNEEAKKAVIIGKRKVEKKLQSRVDVSGPRWYQELSMSQLQHVLALGKVIAMDYEEWITARTQQALWSIGVTSTFVQIPPPAIRKLQRASKLNPIEFLRQIYRRLSGKYFEEEGHKKSYDCNEKIILSTIAILALPDALVELNKRLPPIRLMVYPRKPKCPRNEGSRSGTYQSPYLEPIIGPIDWAAYQTRLRRWEEKCRRMPKPRIILPFLQKTEPTKFIRKDVMKIVDDTATNSESEPSGIRWKNVKKCNIAEDTTPRMPHSSAGKKEKFDFAIDGLGDASRTVEYKICGTLKPPLPQRKSWLGEKAAQYVVSGIVEDDDPPQCPVTYVMSGVAYVTPKNSDEEFFTELKLGDRGRKIYPKGRKNLSRKWQEWLQDADEHFFEVERQANKLMNSVEATMRLVMPEGRCDTCCSCRQTRKSNLKRHATKTPYMVIDSIAEGEDRSKYIVGSLAMHSPAPSLAESTVNLLEVVASKEEVQKKLIINGITSESGATTYYISGITEATEHSKRTTSIKKLLPQPMRDVPTCQCTIERMFNEGLTSDTSDDNIPATKKLNVCFGHKYRPHEAPGYTCKEYPYDKSCRRNPFKARVNERRKPIEECEDADCGGPRKGEEKFTLPTFVPCGDEDGMAVCAGPWGAMNIPDPNIVAAEEEERREILRAPPCGDTPGRAVCGGEWGEKVAKPKVSKSDEDEDEESEEEDTETEDNAKESKAKSRRAEIERARLKRKELNTDKLCSVIPSENDAAPTKSAVYCELDEPWNVARTAPTAQVTGIEYEKSLNLTSKVVPPQDSVSNPKLSTRRRQWNLKTSSRIDRNPTTRDRKRKKSGPRKNTGETTAMIESTKDAVKVIRRKNLSQSAKDYPVANSKRRNNAKSKEQSPMSRDRGERKIVSDDESTGIEVSEVSKHRVKEAEKSNVKLTKEQNRTMRVDGKLGWSNSAKNGASIRHQSKNKKEAGFLHKGEREQDTQAVDHAKKTGKALFRSKKKREKNVSEISQRPSTWLLAETRRKNTSDVVSAALEQNTPRLLCRRESNNALVAVPSACENCIRVQSESSIRKDGPFGWRTKSQQQLPPEKTIVYLTERNSPVETIPLREGGRPCKCRENRNKKKMLIYNIGGLVDDGSKKRRGIPQVIEGVTFATPPPSPRVSDEYIPEYELYDSPYETCGRKQSTHSSKYMQQYLGPRSLLPKKERNLAPCSCRNDHRLEVDEAAYTRVADKEQREVLEAKNPTTTPDDTSANLHRWKAAAKDKDLVDYFVRGHDSVPCWLTCSKFPHNRSKLNRLKVMKPVCECKYERKLVKREEEKTQWVERQRRLKSKEKQGSLHVSGLSRPMRQDTKLVISSVKKLSGDDERDGVPRYCVTGVAENYSMGPIQPVVSGTTMHSPLVTPEPSKTDIPCLCGHKHWSPTEIRNLDDTAKDDFKSASDQSDPNKVNLGCGGGLICKQKDDLLEKSFVTRKLLDKTDNKIRDAAKYSKKSKISGRTAKNETKMRETMQSIGANTTRTVNSGNLKIPRSLVETSRNYQASEDAHKNSDSDDDEPIAGNESDLFNAMMIELKKMAKEGFIFAKLPKCWLVPQLRAWIDCREEKTYSESTKKNSVVDSKKLWQLMDKNKLPDIVVPSFDCSVTPSRQVTYDDMEKVKKQATAMREKFLSEQRKIRVSLAQSYWKTMDFPRFPSISFKKAYFTYLAAKETDGHLFHPWKTSEHKGR